MLSEFLEDFPSVTSAEAIATIEEARTSLSATLKWNCSSMSVTPDFSIHAEELFDFKYVYYSKGSRIEACPDALA